MEISGALKILSFAVGCSITLNLVTLIVLVTAVISGGIDPTKRR